MQGAKFLNTYRIESTRLSGHDHSASAKYFITINIYRNKNYFASIVQTCPGTSPQKDENIISKTHQGASLRFTSPPTGTHFHAGLQSLLNYPPAGICAISQ
jgi:hypothetical protein